MKIEHTGYAVVVILSLILGGCVPSSKVGAEFTVLSGNISLDVPIEVPLDPSIGCLFEIYGEENRLRGSTRLDDSIYAFAIDLETKTSNRLEPGVKIPHPVMRYTLETRNVSPDQTELWGYDLIEGMWSHLATGKLEFPMISNEIAVWAERSPNELNIFGYNLETMQPFTVTTGAGFRGYPKISENWVLYLAPNDSYTYMIHAHNFVTKDEVSIGAIPTYEAVGLIPTNLFDIDQEKIVWRTFNKEIYVYNLVSQTEKLVFQGGITDTVDMVDIAGDLVLWHKGINDIRGYDLLNKVSFNVPNEPPQAEDILVNFSSVRLTDNYVVWLVREDHRPDWALGTPFTSENTIPTPPDLVAEGNECNQRLFIAAVIRK